MKNQKKTIENQKKIKKKSKKNQKKIKKKSKKNQCKKCKLKNFISILHSSVFQHRYYRRYKFHQYKFQLINQSI